MGFTRFIGVKNDYLYCCLFGCSSSCVICGLASQPAGAAMNWNSDDDQDYGIQEAAAAPEKRWCCLMLFLAAVAVVIALFVGYILFA